VTSKNLPFRIVRGGRPGAAPKRNPTVNELLDLLVDLEDRCGGEPHAGACVFCGTTLLGDHTNDCPWPRVLDIVDQ
jgi:hypothetical protein